MSERAPRRFPFGRRGRSGGVETAETAETAEPVAAEVPCLPCAKQASLRTFSLNPVTAASITDDLVPDLDPAFQYAMLAGEVVLFDPTQTTSTLLNTSAALVWASIDGRTPVATIIEELVADTGADPAVVDHDVRDAIARFTVAGIVAPRTDARADPTAVAPVDPVAVAAAEAHERRRTRRAERIDAVLERIPWCAGPGPRRCGDLAVEVRTDDPELAALLVDAMVELPAADHADWTISVVDRRVDAPRRFRLLLGTEVRNWSASPPAALDAVFTELNDLVSTRTRNLLVLHAGAVARDGAVTVIAGPSGRGKSTLTAALVQRGFTYLTDEVVTIDPATGIVVPYPKPLDLEARAQALLGLDVHRGASEGRKTKVPVDRVGRASTDPGRVAAVVLLDDPDPDPAAGPPPASPGAALIDLLANTFPTTFAPGSSGPDPLGALAALVTDVGVLRLGRTPLDETCAAIERHLDARPVRAP